jgi:hypothetical protein
VQEVHGVRALPLARLDGMKVAHHGEQSGSSNGGQSRAAVKTAAWSQEETKWSGFSGTAHAQNKEAIPHRTMAIGGVWSPPHHRARSAKRRVQLTSGTGSISSFQIVSII